MRDALYADQVFQIIPTDQPGGLLLIGRADLSHRAVLEREMQRALRAGVDLHVDVSGLEFIDIGGVRLLVDTAALLALEGRKLVINGPRPVLVRSLRVCGWDTADNIGLVGDGRAANGGNGVQIRSQREAL